MNRHDAWQLVQDLLDARERKQHRACVVLDGDRASSSVEQMIAALRADEEYVRLRDRALDLEGEVVAAMMGEH